MSFLKLFVIYAVLMTAVIVSIVFDKGAIYREVLHEGAVTKGRVTSIEREFRRNDGRLRAHIYWSVNGQASTLTTGWEKGPFSKYSVGSEVDLIIHQGRAHFLGEAKAVGGGWLLWAGWIFIVVTPGILFYFLGLFRANLDVQSETNSTQSSRQSRPIPDGSSEPVLPAPSCVSSHESVPMQAIHQKQFQLAKVITPALFLLGFLALDVIYLRWAVSSEPQGDVLERIVFGLLLAIATVLSALTVQQRIAAAMKGSLRIIFKDRPYTWGETLTGEILLHTRERLLLERLTLTLSAHRRMSGGRNNDHRWEKVIEQSLDLAVDENLLPGTRWIPFSIQIPARRVRSAPEWPDESKGVGALIEGVQRTFSRLDLASQLEWALDAKAQMPGADLEDSHTLRFNS